MEALERRIEYYRTAGGRFPYWEWHHSLKDTKTQAIVDVRLVRVRAGNFGSCEPIGEGVLELKIDFGPGYRIYFGQVGRHAVLLLTGGDKSTQHANIQKAKEFWRDYKVRCL